MTPLTYACFNVIYPNRLIPNLTCAEGMATHLWLTCSLRLFHWQMCAHPPLRLRHYSKQYTTIYRLFLLIFMLGVAFSDILTTICEVPMNSLSQILNLKFRIVICFSVPMDKQRFRLRQTTQICVQGQGPHRWYSHPTLHCIYCHVVLITLQVSTCVVQHFILFNPDINHTDTHPRMDNTSASHSIS
jgi:hypothetical protein